MKVFHYIYVRARARFLLSYSTLGDRYGHSWIYAINALNSPTVGGETAVLPAKSPTVGGVFKVLNMAGYSTRIVMKIATFSTDNQLLRVRVIIE